MKLFAIQAYGTYGGGWALVRAKSKAEARKLAATVRDGMWDTRYDKPESVVELTDKGAGVLYHYETGE